MRTACIALCITLITTLMAPPIPAANPLPRLKVSDNRRFLLTEDNRPFFYLGDTAWELFHRADREAADFYLQNRADRAFNVIQTVALAERDGLREPNPYGHLPLHDNDPARPNEDYFNHVDYIVDKANSLGLYIGFLPTWGDKWNHNRKSGGPQIFTPKNAEVFGQFLGKRYKDKGIIWILGGDRIVDKDIHKDIMRAMAKGLRAGDNGAHLITFHPRGGEGSAQYFHDEPWLDFNMRQNGHGIEFNVRYLDTAADYARIPVKPVFDGEPVYEDHPISFRPADLGHSLASDCRRALYWGLFSGGFGHTYGHHSVWQMWEPKHQPVNGPLMPWREALDRPGAAQMQHGRRLIESRPFLTRIPDDSLILPAPVPTSIPGAGARRLVATRDQDGTYAFVYTPASVKFSVKTAALKSGRLKAWWFNPRTGQPTEIAEFPNTPTREFRPPDPGELLDWILVLDDPAKNYPPPGTSTP